MINPKRIIRLIQGCGRTVPRNFACGTKIVEVLELHLNSGMHV
ncbi:hypothetical protein KY285_033821 [Solanum tuberosum]|nr:hypothetical protein KY285_033821 [Solanum tuberosum]